MHLRSWVWGSAVINFAQTAAGLPQETPFPLTNTSAPTNPPRNPCTDDTFQPPIYQFSNESAVIEFFYNLDPTGNYYSTVKFKVTDIANNYSLRCTWGPEYQGFARDWIGGCTPEAGPEWSRKQDVTLLRLVPDSLMKHKGPREQVHFLQYWYCDIKNGSYPEVYQSRASVYLGNFTCPLQGQRSVDYPCNVSSTSPITVKGEWYGRGALPRTPQLAPRPSPPPPPARGLSPPPAKDCTELSLTHPEWGLNSFSALPAIRPGEERTARVNLTITSRASGVRAECKFDENSKNDLGTLYLDCTLRPSNPESRSKFTILYYETFRRLSIEEEWVCGDTNGQYSSTFTARSNPALPTYSTPGSPFITSESMTIRGEFWYPRPFWSPSLPPPPPNLNSPSCLTRYQTDPFHLWTLTEFLYQRTNITVTGNYGPGLRGDGLPYPHSQNLTLTLRNEANAHTTTCTFSSPTLNSLTPTTWLPCNLPIPAHTFPRYTLNTLISFNPLTGELRLNQTWYCSSSPSTSNFQITSHGTTTYGYDKLIQGSSSNSAYNLVCGSLIAPLICNVTYTADWWSLGGDRDGKGTPIRIATNFERETTVTKLPDNAFTAPDPEEGRWSCTVSSMGKGPVEWRLDVSEYGYLGLMAWHGHWRSDTTFTRLRLDLESSVWKGSGIKGGGVVKGLGNMRVTDWESDAVKTTPWVGSWDPSWTYRSGERDDREFYNFLDWSVRFDLTTGYMELSHSWYCDDKNPERPIVFRGTWNGFIPLDCKYKFGDDREGFEDGIVCLPAGGDTVVVTPVVTADAVDYKIPDSS
ncbi:hypothetical protein B0T14DRAFT_603396 [Immersiella caudata]|uniref:Ig-like domain-containing protein n=1 Tax=Immersiella caudata TaxID=314043 RepID=A0AA40BZW7_9PEZI|nr:hypothetical protein B0T14DRAFT_603396 [Immersiella caudata]